MDPSKATMTFRELVAPLIGLHTGIDGPHSFENQGNGIIATQSISANSLLVSIPKSQLFSTNTVLSHAKLGRIVVASFHMSPLTPLTAMETLALGLLYFKANPEESSFWESYIATLPPTFDSLIFWSAEELALLGSSYLVCRLERRKAKISRLHANLLAILQKTIDRSSAQESILLEAVTLESFTWAYAVVMSRSVFVDGNALSKSSPRLYKNNAALPPFLDFFNHINETSCAAGFNPKSQCYELRTDQDWEQGVQVFIKYGSHSNSTLLTHYGFAISDNLYDSILLDLNLEALISESGSMAEAKLAKLHQYGLIGVSASSQSKTKHELNLDGIGWNTMVAIKTLLIKTEEELANWDNLLEDMPLSDSNEKDFRRFLLDHYGRCLAEIDQAEVQDCANSLYSMVNTYRRSLASTFRSGAAMLLKKALLEIDGELD